jgi:hypothetical protein
MKRSIFWVVAALFLGLSATGFLRAGGDAEQAKLISKLRKAKLEAARQTYKVTWQNYKDGLAPPVELPYRWSCRWLQAQREMSGQKAEQIAAFQAHWERMREMERIERELRRSRLNPINEVTAAEYYRTEAEIWLAQTKDGGAPPGEIRPP